MARKKKIEAAKYSVGITYHQTLRTGSDAGCKRGREFVIGQQSNGKWYISILNVLLIPEGHRRFPEASPSEKEYISYLGGSRASGRKAELDPDSVDMLLDAMMMVKTMMAKGENLADFVKARSGTPT